MVETPELRRRTMQAVKSIDTAPELATRRVLHAEGYRYRLHASRLPGKPDIVLASRSKAIFVHGCFWHGHDCPRGRRQPKTNALYWTAKIARNRARDRHAMQELWRRGWTVLVIWECETKDLATLRVRLTNFLGPSKNRAPKQNRKN